MIKGYFSHIRDLHLRNDYEFQPIATRWLVNSALIGIRRAFGMQKREQLAIALEMLLVEVSIPSVVSIPRTGLMRESLCPPPLCVLKVCVVSLKKYMYYYIIKTPVTYIHIDSRHRLNHEQDSKIQVHLSRPIERVKSISDQSFGTANEMYNVINGYDQITIIYRHTYT